MLRDVSIRLYRALKDFKVDGLASINLIVGANNSGKTSLLEAIYLLVNRNNPSALGELMEKRGEVTDAHVAPGLFSYQIEHIFFGHNLQSDLIAVLRDGLIIESRQDDPLWLRISLRPIDPSSISDMHVPILNAAWGNEPTPYRLVFEYRHPNPYGSDDSMRIPVRGDYSVPDILLRPRKQSNPYVFVTADIPDFAQLAELWNNVALTPREEDVVKALQILEPNVEGIRFLSRQTANSGIIIRLKGQPGPVPLGSMGDGMRRVLTLIMSAIQAERGVLLVDEIDTGLYHGAQTDLWRLLIEMVRRLNIQIFATTHSWDCVAAFQEALGQDGNEGELGRLFRLQLRDGAIETVRYEVEGLAIAVREGIEVR